MKKSLKRKLLLSGLAMGVAAVSLASTTYAWFSNITVVEANDINASVQVPTSLLISNDNQIFLAKVNLATDNHHTLNNIDPVQADWSSLNAPVFKELDQTKKENVKSDGSYGANSDRILDDSLLVASSNDVFTDEFWLTYEAAEDADDLAIEAIFNVTTEAQTLAGAVKFVLLEETATDVWTEVMGPTAITELSKKDLGTIGVGDVRHFRVYLYLDGTDTDCYNSAITSDTEFGVDISITEKATS